MIVVLEQIETNETDVDLAQNLATTYLLYGDTLQKLNRLPEALPMFELAYKTGKTCLGLANKITR